MANMLSASSPRPVWLVRLFSWRDRTRVSETKEFCPIARCGLQRL